MKYFQLFLPLLIAFLSSSCEPKIEPEPVVLSAQPDQLLFEAAGGTLDLTITCGIKPIVSCNEKWISLSEGTYAANTLRVSVKAQENTGTATRVTSIRVIGDKQSLMIPVSQDIPQVELTVDRTSVAFDRFETNERFLDKTEEGLRTLHQFRYELDGYSRLLRTAKIIESLHLKGLCNKIFAKKQQRWRRDLCGSPSLRLFKYYKLFYFLSL